MNKTTLEKLLDLLLLCSSPAQAPVMAAGLAMVDRQQDRAGSRTRKGK